MKRLVVILALVSLACSQASNVTVSSAVAYPTHTAEEVSTDVKMTVTAEKLYIRVAPGERSALVEHYLIQGDTVMCSEFIVVGDGLWCHHERGYSNARYLNSK